MIASLVALLPSLRFIMALSVLYLGFTMLIRRDHVWPAWLGFGLHFPLLLLTSAYSITSGIAGHMMLIHGAASVAYAGVIAYRPKRYKYRK